MRSIPVTAAPFGSWASPFKIERLTDRVVFRSEVKAADGMTWWLEGRPDEPWFNANPRLAVTHPSPPT